MTDAESGIYLEWSCPECGFEIYGDYEQVLDRAFTHAQECDANE